MKALIAAALLLPQLNMACMRQGEKSRQPFAQIVCRSSKEVSVKLESLATREPAHPGESGTRANLLLTNSTGKEEIYVAAFALDSSENSNALLHDVYEGEACRQAIHGSSRNDDPGGELDIGYSKRETFGILHVIPGDSLEFSVPIDHLSDGRCVRVRYWSYDESAVVPKDQYRYIWIAASPK
jgi:hypothetical protein